MSPDIVFFHDSKRKNASHWTKLGYNEAYEKRLGYSEGIILPNIAKHSRSHAYKFSAVANWALVLPNKLAYRYSLSFMYELLRAGIHLQKCLSLFFFLSVALRWRLLCDGYNYNAWFARTLTPAHVRLRINTRSRAGQHATEDAAGYQLRLRRNPGEHCVLLLARVAERKYVSQVWQAIIAGCRLFYRGGQCRPPDIFKRVFNTGRKTY